ncbi:MAG TPA: L,D-transpeptidase family protein [Bacteroidia bacterium]|jgi:murein L,D-transpeptidase YafK|nr:L,D-transpeptidase family protein [Bacteroidia bacterium]
MKNFGRTITLFVSITLLSWIWVQSTLSAPSTSSFRNEQKKAPKVKEAYDLKWVYLKHRLDSLGMDTSSLKIFIRGFKQEHQLEVWVRSPKTTWKLFDTYVMCYISGDVGPKRCQGDGQVPEGFYHVSVFNPYSNYLISLGVSYPNASDNIFGCARDKGGAIMIHGNCVSIGCIPITDDKIREVYVLAVEAKTDGQSNIPIHIFPTRMSIDNLAPLKVAHPDATLSTFWDNLKDGYDYFQNNHEVPDVTIDAKGKYLFK